MRARVLLLVVAVAALVAAAVPGSAAPAAPVERPSGCLAAPAFADPTVEPSRAAAPPLVSGTCPGIRPGAQMNSPSGCTMNFVFRNGPTGTDRYIGTAAHCVSAVGQSVHMVGEGRVGQVAWSGWLDTNNGEKPGIDFALVKIDPGKLSRVNPQMCHWGGPVAMLTSPPPLTSPTPVVHYGHGIGTGTLVQTKARRGVGYGWVEGAFWFVGAVSFGDSGSPVMTDSGLAAGVAVEITAFDNKASRVDDGIRMASATLGVDLRLVTAPLA